MSNNCDHQPRYQVTDEHEGSVICSACGMVTFDMLDPTLRWDDSPREKIFTIISNFCERFNIHMSIEYKAKSICTQLKCLQPKRSVFYLALYSIYNAAFTVETPYTLEEMSNMSGIRLKQLNRVFGSISKSTNYIHHHQGELKSEHYVDRFLSGILTAKERSGVRSIIQKLPDNLKSKSLKVILGGAAFYYFKDDANRDQVLKVIINHLNVKIARVREFAMAIEDVATS